MVTDHLLIDGRLVSGNGPSFDVIYPANGQVHTTLSASDEAQLASATAAAAAAQPGWQARSQPDRSKMIHAVADAIEAEREMLATALTH